jgi:hypothetical protein
MEMPYFGRADARARDAVRAWSGAESGGGKMNAERGGVESSVAMLRFAISRDDERISKVIKARGPSAESAIPASRRLMLALGLFDTGAWALLAPWGENRARMIMVSRMAATAMCRSLITSSRQYLQQGLNAFVSAGE